MLEQFRGSVDELAWRFQRGDAALGIRGQSFADGGTGVWDEAASQRAHRMRRTEPYRYAVQRVAKIDGTLAGVASEAHRAMLRRAFAPFGRVSWRLHVAFSFGDVSLIGVAVVTRAARLQYARAHDTVVEPDLEQLVAWLEDEATSLDHALREMQRLKTGLPSRHFFERIRTETVEVLRPALVAYDEQRQRRLAEEGERKEALDKERQLLLDEELERLHVKLWGRP